MKTNLNELIDLQSSSVEALARSLGMSAQATAEKLTQAYDDAQASGKLRQDSSSICFDCEEASVTLVTNNEYASPFAWYLKFRCKAADGELALPQTLCEGVKIPAKTLDYIRTFTEEPNQTDEELIAVLDKAYQTAYEETKTPNENGEMIFDTTLKNKSGRSIFACVSPSGYDRPWYLRSVFLQRANELQPQAELHHFASIGNPNEYFADLAKLAAPEKWDNENGPYDILRNHLCVTFYRLKREGKICYSEDRSYAAFHTGLVTADYEDIYAFFFAGSADSKQPWKALGFCTAANGAFSRKLLESISKLPQPPAFLNKTADVLYNTDCELFVDYDHILIDHLERIPPAALQEAFGEDSDNLRYVQTTNAEEPDWELLRERLRSKDALYGSIKKRLEEAVRTALQRLRWDYRLAIPSYYPRHDKMSFLLPLDFSGNGEADAALVVEHLAQTNRYRGQTILTKSMAYANARLVSRQEQSWLHA